MYKTAAYLPRCIDSLLDQDIPAEDYEIILVDDGSPDRDLEIARDYASRHSNIRVISHPNKGLAGARNTGVEAAEGQYLRFVDPDDYIERGCLKALLDRMDEENLDMLRFNYQMVNESYEPIDKPKDARIIDYTPGIYDGKKYLVERQGFACFVWAFIFKTALIKPIPFRQGDYFDDTAWLPQVFCAAGRVDTVPDVCSYYLQRGDSLVNVASVDALKKKLDAQVVLVERLSSKFNENEDPVGCWYRGMCAKIVLSSLTSSALADLPMSIEYAKRYKEMKVFPLKGYLTSFTQKAKYLMMNISPVGFCRLYHLVATKL